jgi:hypothetical protein
MNKMINGFRPIPLLLFLKHLVPVSTFEHLKDIMENVTVQFRQNAEKKRGEGKQKASESERVELVDESEDKDEDDDELEMSYTMRLKLDTSDGKMQESAANQSTANKLASPKEIPMHQLSSKGLAFQLMGLDDSDKEFNLPCLCNQPAISKALRSIRDSCGEWRQLQEQLQSQHVYMKQTDVQGIRNRVRVLSVFELNMRSLDPST